MAVRVPGLFDDVSLLTSFPPIHVNVAELDTLILLHGDSGELRRCQRCPCIRPDSTTPRDRCPICHGVGLTYPPTKREPLVFLDASRTSSYRKEGVGTLDDGQISITVPSGILPGRGDLLIPDGEFQIVHETFWRDFQQVSRRALTDRILVSDQQVPPLGPRATALLYPTVTQIEALFWIHGDELVEAVPGVDYRLGPNATIEWVSPTAPAQGAGFTVRYQAPAAYQIWSSVPRLRHEGGGPAAPYNCKAQRLDKIQREADVL